MKKALALLFLLSTQVFSLSHDLYELALFGGEPSSLVAGAVSALTGDYFVSDTMMEVRGLQPIRLERMYLSRHGQDKRGGWSYGFNHLCGVLQTGPTYHFLKIPERCGVSLIYAAPFGHLITKEQASKFQLFDAPALTNCSTGEIGARLNLRNNVVYRDIKDPKQFIVEGADGSKRCYRIKQHGSSYKMKEERIPLFLEWEYLPNGNLIRYNFQEIEGRQYLVEVRATSPDEKQLYSRVTLSYKQPNSKHLYHVKVCGSDGQEILLKINPHHKNHGKRFWLFTDFFSSTKPDENYQYENWKEKGCFLKGRTFPDGRKLEIDYYMLGENHLPRGMVKIKKPTGDHYQKVKSLKAPIGEDIALQPTHTFYYDPGKFREEGGTTDVLDALSNLTRYHYNKDFLLTQVERFTGEHTLFSSERFQWHPSDSACPNWLQGKSVLDGSGNTCLERSYIYDEKGNVTQEQLKGNHTGEGLSTYTIKRQFYPNNLLAREEHPNGLVHRYLYVPNTDLIAAKFICHRDVIKIRHYYDYQGSILVQETIDDGKYEDKENLSGVTERRVKKVIPRLKGPFIGFPEEVADYYTELESRKLILMSKKKLSYNKKGLVEAIAHHDSDDVHCFTTRYTYDAKDRLIEETDPLGRPKKTAYDANNNVVAERDPNHQYRTQRTYDHSNRVKSESLITPANEKRLSSAKYNALHQKISESNSQGHMTRYLYDPFGRPLEAHLPAIGSETPVIKRTYNALGHTLTETDPLGHVTKTESTLTGHPYRVIHPDSSEERLIYTMRGQVAKEMKPDGTMVHITYDFLDRELSKCIFGKEGELLSQYKYEYSSFHLLSETHPDGEVTRYTHDGAGRKASETEGGRTRRFEYDSQGRLSKTIEESRIFTKQYDLLDRVVRETEEDREGNLYCFTNYQYDDFNNQTHLVKEVQVGESITKMEYDSFHRLIKTTNPLGHVTEHQYNDHYQNPYGQRVTQKITIDPLLTKTVETYTSHGEIATSETFNPEGELLLSETFHYNAKGEKTEQVSHRYDPHVTTTKSWEYDSMGRLTTFYEGKERTTHYYYDSCGRLVKKAKPDGVELRYRYDGLGRQAELWSSDQTLHYTFQYDSMGNITSSTDQIHKTHISRRYDHFGNLLSETLPDGSTLSKTYDPFGRTLSFTLPDRSFIEYTYNPFHLIAINRYGANDEHLYTHNYHQYDRSHNLTQEKGLGGAAHHTLDLLSRRTLTESTYSAESIIEFDPVGNVLSYERTLPDHVEKSTYTYDALHQLTSERGLFSHDYTCDAHHNLLKKDQEEFTSNELNELDAYSYDQNGNQTSGTINRFRYDPLDRLIAIEKNSHLYTPYHDLFGNIIALAGPTDRPTEHYRYSAFGKETLSHPPATPWRFQSKRTTASLISFGRRFYDPESGRFLSPDPKGYSEGPNLYQYVKNNPFTHIDLYGLSSLAASWEMTKNALYYNARTITGGKTPLAPGQFLSHLPHAIYVAFKQKAPGNIPIPTVETVGSKINPLATFIYSYGINTTISEGLSQAQKWSSQLGGQQFTVFCKPRQNILDDLVDVFADKLGVRTPKVAFMAQYLEQIQSPSSVFLGHSAGAVEAFRAVQLLSERQRNTFELHLFGTPHIPAASYAQSISCYISNNDYIARFPSIIGTDRGSGKNAPHVEYLKSRHEGALQEHGINNHTYRNRSDKLLSDFHERYQLQKYE